TPREIEVIARIAPPAAPAGCFPGYAVLTRRGGCLSLEVSRLARQFGSERVAFRGPEPTAPCWHPGCSPAPRDVRTFHPDCPGGTRRDQRGDRDEPREAACRTGTLHDRGRRAPGNAHGGDLRVRGNCRPCSEPRNVDRVDAEH